jgi:hypothetical protein
MRSLKIRKPRPHYADNRRPLRELARRFTLRRPSNRRNDKQTAPTRMRIPAHRRIRSVGNRVIKGGPALRRGRNSRRKSGSPAIQLSSSEIAATPLSPPAPHPRLIPSFAARSPRVLSLQADLGLDPPSPTAPRFATPAPRRRNCPPAAQSGRLLNSPRFLLGK